MAKKKAKKTRRAAVAPIPPTRASLYHFTCLGCDFGAEVMAETQQEALSLAFAKHDKYHRSAGVNCGSDNYEITSG